MVFLTPKGHIEAPWIPPELVNHDKPIFSLGTMTKWLGKLAEEKGVCFGMASSASASARATRASARTAGRRMRSRPATT
jgi:hypothetical protein